jgi:hypothetical protein
MVRSDFLVDAQGLNQVNGLPFRRVDIELAIISQLGTLRHRASGGKADRGSGGDSGNVHSEEQK